MTLFNKTKQNNDLIWIDTQGYEPVILQGAKKLIESKAPVVIEFWPYALKRANLWEKMFEVLKHFNFYVDLSNQELYLNKINEVKDNSSSIFKSSKDPLNLKHKGNQSEDYGFISRSVKM